MLTLIAACGNKDDKSAKAPDLDLLKTQKEALEQAKQVEQVTLDAAEQQRQRIEQEIQ
jgi:hypothetical protein